MSQDPRKPSFDASASSKKPELSDLGRPSWVEPWLGEEAWTVFAALWDEALRKAGLKVIMVEPDGVHHIDVEGLEHGIAQLGLGGLVRGIAHKPSSEWAELIEAHLRTVTDVGNFGPADPGNLRLRLAASDETMRLAEISSLAPGLSIVLVEDQPQLIRYLPLKETAGELGMPPDKVIRLAMTNLHHALGAKLREVPGTPIKLFAPEVSDDEQSSYGASALITLTMDDLRAEGIEPDRGVLVAIPSSAICLLAPIPPEGPTEVISPLLAMTAGMHDDAVRPLYANLLWWASPAGKGERVEPIMFAMAGNAPIVGMSQTMITHFGLHPSTGGTH